MLLVYTVNIPLGKTVQTACPCIKRCPPFKGIILNDHSWLYNYSQAICPIIIGPHIGEGLQRSYTVEPSNKDTVGTVQSVLIKEVSLFQG